ncbi:MAG: hypothetical protein K2X35_14070 [Bryobacteraceae bacterium]|nr:hypothetical protein [Bryobacteraceae bacterium]
MSAVPPIVRAEGLTERFGDVNLRCTGGIPNTQIQGNLAVFVTTPLTNRLGPGDATNVILTVDRGNGPEPANVPGIYLSGNSITWNGLIVNLSPEGAANIRIANLRGVVTQNVGGTIFASISNTGLNQISILNQQVAIATVLPSLLASTVGRLICAPAGSPVPETESPTFDDFLRARTVTSTTRLSEGFADAFATRFDAPSFLADTGTRFLVRFTGLPGEARLFVPVAVAGYDAIEATSAGSLGRPASGGVFRAGSGALLLSLVIGADTTGAGGQVELTAPLPPAADLALSQLRELPVEGGVAYAVYEVISANSFSRQSVELPTFLGIPAGAVNSETPVSQTVTLAPVSTLGSPSRTAPVPRFIATRPGRDCENLGDCRRFFPTLEVRTTAVNFSVPQNAPLQAQILDVRNTGGGQMPWTASLTYTKGEGFLRVGPQSWIGNGAVQVDLLPGRLAPGTYSASLRIDAGPEAGSAVIPIHVEIKPPVPLAPVITTVRNAASNRAGAVVPGSLATIEGQYLSGAQVDVTFGGAAAQVVSATADRLDFVVPPLAGGSSAEIIVRVDGLSSAARRVNIQPFVAAIFPGGVLNEDWSANRESRPAQPGRYLQIFTSGLPQVGEVTVKIHDREGLRPAYVGAAPGSPGVQQINVHIPEDLPSMQTYVYVCVGSGDVVCSEASLLYLRR